jgi:hypothetical protein
LTRTTCIGSPRRHSRRKASHRSVSVRARGEKRAADLDSLGLS